MVKQEVEKVRLLEELEGVVKVEEMLQVVAEVTMLEEAGTLKFEEREEEAVALKLEGKEGQVEVV